MKFRSTRTPFLPFQIAPHLFERLLATESNGIHISLDDAVVVVGRLIHPGIDFSPRRGFGWVERWLGEPLFEVSQDIHRLRNDHAVVHEIRHEACGVDPQLLVFGILPRKQVDRVRRKSEVFFRQCQGDPLCTIG